jgi:hypothetical protein
LSFSSVNVNKVRQRGANVQTPPQAQGKLARPS